MNHSNESCMNRSRLLMLLHLTCTFSRLLETNLENFATRNWINKQMNISNQNHSDPYSVQALHYRMFLTKFNRNWPKFNRNFSLSDLHIYINMYYYKYNIYGHGWPSDILLGGGGEEPKPNDQCRCIKISFGWLFVVQYIYCFSLKLWELLRIFISTCAWVHGRWDGGKLQIKTIVLIITISFIYILKLYVLYTYSKALNLKKISFS